jgi:putative ABC transport system permease protein
VSSVDGALPGSLLGTLDEIEGVDRGAAVLSADVLGPDGEPIWTFGVDPASTGPVLRSTDELPLPVPGQAVLPEWLAESWSVRDGDDVTLGGAGQERSFTALVADSGQPLMLTAGDLRAVAPETGTGTGELWLRLTDAEPGQVEVVDRITDVVAEADPSAQVTGLVTLRDQIDEVLDLLLLIVTGLLGIAVVIALIGVGNTLALSVVERRQENGLLRALGLTRRQLRGLLAWEAVLVAGVAAVLGVLIGGAYGLIGAASVLGEIGEIVLSVPWLQVAAIVVVATVAGLLASVLPARRAARTAPVAAIAG